MKKFSDLGVTSTSNIFVGDKIKIAKILNREIVVCACKIETSKFQKNKSGKCLHMQIIFNDEKQVVFTGSDVLIDVIEKIDESCYPFTTTIIKSGEHFEFS